MNSIGEPPAAIARIMEAADPRYVKLLFDTAHYQQGGGDPILGIRQYADRLAFIHLKDLETGDRNDSGFRRVGIRGLPGARLRNSKFR